MKFTSTSYFWDKMIKCTSTLYFWIEKIKCIPIFSLFYDLTLCTKVFQSCYDVTRGFNIEWTKCIKIGLDELSMAISYKTDKYKLRLTVTAGLFFIH